MSNRLRAYVRRTMLAAARDYAGGKRRTKDSTRSAFIDAMRGTDTGWWNDLIYTAPMLDMAHRYRRDIAAALEAYADEVGQGWTMADRGNDPVIYFAAIHDRYSFDDYRGDNGVWKQRRAEAKLDALRFAVEWYAGEVAREFCPDL